MNLKLEKLLTAGFAAALGASFIAANPVEARNGWVITTDQPGYRVFNKYISRSGNIVTCHHKRENVGGESTSDIKQANCSAWSMRTNTKWGWGNWSEILPETIGDYSLRAMCR